MPLYSTAKRETATDLSLSPQPEEKSLPKTSARVGPWLFNLEQSLKRYKNKTRRIKKRLMPIVAVKDV